MACNRVSFTFYLCAQKGTAANSGSCTNHNINIQKHIKKPQLLMAFRTTANVKTIIEFLVLSNYEPEVMLC